MSEDKLEKAAFICSRDTLDGAYPALLLAINAAREGMEGKIFYTFMGLNLLLKGGFGKAKFIPPGVMGAIPGMDSIATAKRFTRLISVPMIMVEPGGASSTYFTIKLVEPHASAKATTS